MSNCKLRLHGYSSSYLAQVGFPVVSHIREWSLDCHIKTPLLTKLAKSTRWLDIGLNRFCVCGYGP